MKKSKKTLLAVASLALLFIAISTCLIPSRNHFASEKGLNPDTNQNQIYQNDVLKEFEMNVNAKVGKTLNEIELSRQSNAILLADEMKKHGANSQEVCNMYTRNAQLEESYCKMVTEIINKYGWLGAERIGAQNNYTLFTTIQNADFETQDKFMSVMENAVKSGSLSAEHFAKLVDRKALAQHNVQIYGTQLVKDPETLETKLAPVADLSSLNKRRSEIGLSPYYTTQEGNSVKVILTNKSTI